MAPRSSLSSPSSADRGPPGPPSGGAGQVQLGALGYGPTRLAALGVGLRRVVPRAGSETGAAAPKCMPRAVPVVAATIAAISPLLAPRTESPRAPVAPRCLSFRLGDRCPAGPFHAPGTGGERCRGRHSCRHWPPRHATGAEGGGRAPHNPPSSTACEGVVHRKRRRRPAARWQLAWWRVKSRPLWPFDHPELAARRRPESDRFLTAANKCKSLDASRVHRATAGAAQGALREPAPESAAQRR